MESRGNGQFGEDTGRVEEQIRKGGAVLCQVARGRKRLNLTLPRDLVVIGDIIIIREVMYSV